MTNQKTEMCPLRQTYWVRAVDSQMYMKSQACNMQQQHLGKEAYKQMALYSLQIETRARTRATTTTTGRNEHVFPPARGNMRRTNRFVSRISDTFQLRRSERMARFHCADHLLQGKSQYWAAINTAFALLDQLGQVPIKGIGIFKEIGLNELSFETVDAYDQSEIFTFHAQRCTTHDFVLK
jgi:hypothetical protein